MTSSGKEAGGREYLLRNGDGCCAAEGHQEAKGLAKVMHGGGLAKSYRWSWYCVELTRVLDVRTKLKSLQGRAAPYILVRDRVESTDPKWARVSRCMRPVFPPQPVQPDLSALIAPS